MSRLPGTRVALGVAMAYLSLLVLVPLSSVFVLAGAMSWPEFTSAAFDARALAAYRLSFGTAAGAAAINVVTGVAIAWVLTRCDFPGRRLIDALIDLPFALPTAVAGVALTTLYAGPYVQTHITVAFAWPGIVVALTFVGLPFVVRTVQSVLADFPAEVEEAAVTLGASPWQLFRRVIFPSLFPAMLTGFGLAFARGLGEYGSVAFISGNMPFRTEMGTQLIMTKLESYEYAGAAAIALVILVASFVTLVVVSALERRAAERGAAT